jgi:hypothetical protein
VSRKNRWSNTSWTELFAFDRHMDLLMEEAWPPYPPQDVPPVGTTTAPSTTARSAVNRTPVSDLLCWCDVSGQT